MSHLTMTQAVLQDSLHRGGKEAVKRRTAGFIHKSAGTLAGGRQVERDCNQSWQVTLPCTRPASDTSFQTPSSCYCYPIATLRSTTLAGSPLAIRACTILSKLLLLLLLLLHVITTRHFRAHLVLDFHFLARPTDCTDFPVTVMVAPVLLA